LAKMLFINKKKKEKGKRKKEKGKRKKERER
jgi:rRNA processing protein Gar1